MAYRNTVRGMLAAYVSKNRSNFFGSRFPASRTHPPTAFWTRSSESWTKTSAIAKVSSTSPWRMLDLVCAEHLGDELARLIEGTDDVEASMARSRSTVARSGAWRPLPPMGSSSDAWRTPSGERQQPAHQGWWWLQAR